MDTDISTSSYRSNHRLFPVSTYTEPVHSNTSHYVQHPKPQYSAGLQKAAILQQQQSNGRPARHPAAQPSPQPSWQSVAELINDFERSKEPATQRYAFIDPNKTHRVSNPALKAFQKNAVQSYFERQQQQHSHQHLHQQLQQQHSKENQQQKMLQIQSPHPHLRPHSFQLAASTKELAAQQQPLRNSLPNTICLQNIHGMPHTQAADDSLMHSYSVAKPPSPAPPPPPPRSRSLMPTLLRRSSSASDYAEYRDHFIGASQEILPSPTIKTISSSEKLSFNDCGMPPPPPPPRGRGSLSVRRTSSASEYAAMRDKVLQQQAATMAHQQHQLQQQQLSVARTHHYYIPSAATPTPSVMPVSDGWVPERPPKNPNLRVPSPDLPPPPADVDAHLSDEPLPPPPPEILHKQQYYDYPNPSSLVDGEKPAKPPSPNRRNSFAGSASHKTFTGRSSETAMKAQPPVIPKKPTNIELHHSKLPGSILVQHANKTHKVVLNSSPSQHQRQQKYPTQHAPPVPPAAKVTANRKRPHNPAMMAVPTTMEPSANVGAKSPSTTKVPNLPAMKPSPPPPLMPRMPVISQGSAVANINNKLRCNSKASYLPRQSLEKLNNSDPDHGSYKLTLTSNEDLVSHGKPTYNILTHNGKLPNNLPDVLPLGAKLQPQPGSPTSTNGSPLRHASSGNLANTRSSPTQQQTPSTYYPSYPVQHRYSSPTMNSYGGNGSVDVPSYNRSQSFDVNSPQAVSAAKFMSQSTIDLKRTNNLETMLEESLTETTKVLSPAHSENNLSSPSKCSPTGKPASPYPTNREYQWTELSGKERVNQPSEGTIFRAELVNTTFSNSPTSGVPNKTVTRKGSLRENIEKITQLQSKLMSAHLSDTGLMSGYTVKSPLNPTTKPGVTSDDNKPPKLNIHNDNNTQEQQNTIDKTIDMLTTVPKTPPPLPESTTEPTSPDPVNAVSAQISQMDSSTDGLKLMQRSELILRVNPATSEAASQTDDLPDCDIGRLTAVHHSKDEPPTRTTLQPRQLHPVEIDCDTMVQELASLLSPNDKLIEILTPRLIKSPRDYICALYNPDVSMRPTKRDVGTSTLMRMKTRDTLEEKNKTVVVELQYTEVEVALTNGLEPNIADVIKKKVSELIRHLNRKIRILNNEQTTIGEESAINDELGGNLANKLADKVRPNEATKFRTYIDDVGHITSLLLSLSERLAKAENSLSAIASNDNSSEKKLLESKRDRLQEQLEEAKRLKEDIDRRGSSVMQLLQKNLTSDDFADFDYFINMKAKLITDARDLADKIKCGEEQLSALSEALVQSDC